MNDTERMQLTKTIKADRDAAHARTYATRAAHDADRAAHDDDCKVARELEHVYAAGVARDYARAAQDHSGTMMRQRSGYVVDMFERNGGLKWV